VSLEGFREGQEADREAAAAGVDHQPMVIDMNEAQVRTLDQVREVVAGTQALEFRPGGDDAARYAWIGSVLRRFAHRSRKRAERGVLLQYLSVLLFLRTTDIRNLLRKEMHSDTIEVQPTKTARTTGVTIAFRISAPIRAVLDRAAAISRSLGRISPYVIHTRQGTSYTRSGIASAFRRAGERAGVRGANAKALRPFAATAAKAQNYSMEAIQDALSQADISTTQGCIHSMARRNVTVKLAIPNEVLDKVLDTSCVR